MTKTERYNTALPSSDNVKDKGVKDNGVKDNGVKEKEAKGASSTAKAAEQTQPAERAGQKALSQPAMVTGKPRADALIFKMPPQNPEPTGLRI